VEKHPGAVVTEYAWDSGSCDPCPEPALDGQELVTLGADTLPLPPIRASGPRTIPPKIRMGATKVKGPLPPEVIQRIVRQSFGRFRMCYENGLRNNPTLEGRVSVAFTIDRTGAVSKPSSAGTDLQDEKVIDCVVRAFNNLSFPEPQGAPVSVIYPIYFSNGAGAAASASSSAAPPPPPPVLAPNPGGFVLTRLHARYRKDGLADDLVFRPAPAIAGGRETRGADQQLEQGASVAPQNTFQGRYAIRHPWEGKITCDQPRRGIWGGPPTGTSTPTRAATGLAFAPRNVPLSRFLPAGIPSGASSVAPPSLPTPAPSGAAPSPSALTGAAPSAGRCGCHTPGGDRSPGGWLALLGLAAIRGRRRPHVPAGRGRALT
jgi:MYXO-CTERM domain-containing protein